MGIDVTHLGPKWRRAAGCETRSKPRRARPGTGERAAHKRAVLAERLRPPVTLTLRVPPSSNRYWAYSRGRVYLTREARAYKQMVAMTCAEQGIEPPFVGPVVVGLKLYNSRLDVDNAQPIIADGLQGSAYVNDRQIVRWDNPERLTDDGPPRVVVTVAPAIGRGQSCER